MEQINKHKYIRLRFLRLAMYLVPVRSVILKHPSCHARTKTGSNSVSVAPERWPGGVEPFSVRQIKLGKTKSISEIKVTGAFYPRRARAGQNMRINIKSL